MTASKPRPIDGLLQSWNQQFSNSPMSEDDIKNTNELKFRSQLILILNALNVDTKCYENMDQETGSRLKMSRCQLVAAVNYFLKIANPQITFFCYKDLVTPSKRNQILL
jgi:hypothetical protein